MEVKEEEVEIKEEGEGEVGGRGREGAGIYLGLASLPDHTVPSDTAALGQTPPRPPLIYHTLPLSLPSCPPPTHHTLCPLTTPSAHSLLSPFTHSLTHSSAASPLPFPPMDETLQPITPTVHRTTTLQKLHVHYSLKGERTISWPSVELTDSSTLCHEKHPSCMRVKGS